jgi:hypothetical protein
MIEPLPEELLERCRSAGVDPAEVGVAASRYRAYRDFYARAGRGEALGVEQWFRWYYVEAASDSDAGKTASPGGCSVESDSRNRGLMTNPAAFLEILRAASRG